MDSDTMEAVPEGTWDGSERRRAWNCKHCAAFAESVKAVEKGNINTVMDVIGTSVGIALGIGVFYATGLADSEPGIVRGLLGAGTVVWMVGMARLGLHCD